MDRVDHVSRLDVPPEAGARPECDHLRALDGAGIAAEQDQVCARMAGTELSDLSRLLQRTRVEDRNGWTVSAQHDLDAAVFHVCRDNREARITSDQLVQASGEKIVEVAEN
jgi:hypothetical protein